MNYGAAAKALLVSLVTIIMHAMLRLGRAICLKTHTSRHIYIYMYRRLICASRFAVNINITTAAPYPIRFPRLATAYSRVEPPTFRPIMPTTIGICGFGGRCELTAPPHPFSLSAQHISLSSSPSKRRGGASA